MNSCMVDINKVVKEGISGKPKTELWAIFRDSEKNEEKRTLIWWEDDEGTFHDETPNLPHHLRDIVDNAWIEHRRHL